MVNQDHINKIDPDLKKILDLELDLGNKIVETSQGWPKPDSIFVSLEKPFLKKHSNPCVTFTNVNDPHYWKWEYSKDNHLLVCRF